MMSEPLSPDAAVSIPGLPHLPSRSCEPGRLVVMSVTAGVDSLGFQSGHERIEWLRQLGSALSVVTGSSRHVLG